MAKYNEIESIVQRNGFDFKIDEFAYTNAMLNEYLKIDSTSTYKKVYYKITCTYNEKRSTEPFTSAEGKVSIHFNN